MKILLLFKPNDNVEDPEETITPLGLRYIAAYLKDKGYDAVLENLKGKNKEDIADIIRQEKPSIIGFTIYTFNRFSALETAKLAKEINPNTKIVLGGPYAHIMYRQLLENFDFVDFIARGEGEETMLELVGRIANNENDFENVNGIVFRKNSSVYMAKTREPLKNLDKFPNPCKYFKYNFIITSRGCPGQCIFCSTPRLWGQCTRFRTAKNVVDEIETLHKRYGINYFVVLDDTFTASKERTIEICKEITARNLKILWDCRARVNFIDDERLCWMKRAGCKMISYGIESGSQKILNNLKKFIAVGQIKEASRLTRKYGMHLSFFLIVGSPGETEGTINETIGLIQETRPHNIIPATMHMEPGTELYDIGKEKGWLADGIWLEDKSPMPEKTIYYYENSREKLREFRKMIEDSFRRIKQSHNYTMDELQSLLKDFPDDAFLLGCIGEHYYLQKDYEKAAEYFEKADSIVPNYPRAMTYLGAAYTKLKQPKIKEAVELFRKTLEIEPDYFLAYNNLGIVYSRLGKFEKARLAFRESLLINRMYPPTYVNLGHMLAAMGNRQGAIDSYTAAIRLGHTDKERLMKKIDDLKKA